MMGVLGVYRHPGRLALHLFFSFGAWQNPFHENQQRPEFKAALRRLKGVENFSIHDSTLWIFLKPEKTIHPCRALCAGVESHAPANESQVDLQISGSRKCVFCRVEPLGVTPVLAGTVEMVGPESEELAKNGCVAEPVFKSAMRGMKSSAELVDGDAERVAKLSGPDINLSRTLKTPW